MTTSTRPAPLLALGLALISVVVWGISFVGTKRVLMELSPMTLSAARSAMGALALIFLLLCQRRPVLPGPHQWRGVFVMAFFGIFMHFMLQTHGLTTTAATHAGWLIGLIPLWTAAIAHIFYKEPLDRLQIAGLTLGFGGALLVIGQGRPLAKVLVLPTAPGDLLVFLSTINWAVYSLLGRSTITALGAIRATAVSMALGTAMLMPFVGGLASVDQLAALSSVGWGWLFFLGLGCSAIGYACWFAALDRAPAARVATVVYLEPLVAWATAAAILSEASAWATLCGGALLLLGMYLSQRR